MSEQENLVIHDVEQINRLLTEAAIADQESLSIDLDSDPEILFDRCAAPAEVTK